MKKAACVLLLLLLCGCAKATELNSLLIISGIAVDKSNGEYLLTTEAVNVHSSDQNEKTAVYFETRGATLAEALSKIVTEDGEKLFFNHTQLIYINSDILKNEGISHIIESVNRESRFRSSVRLAATECRASDVIRAKSKTEKVTSFALNKAIEQSAALLTTPDVPFFRFYNNVLEDGIDGVLPLLSAKTENNETLPFVCGCAIFKDRRLALTLDAKESCFLLLCLKSIEDSALVTDTCVYKIMRSAPKIKCDGKSAVIKIDALLMPLEGNDQSLTLAERDAEKALKDGVKNVIMKAAQEKCDPLGLGRDLKRRSPSLYRVRKENGDIYRGLYIDYDINVKMVTSSKITKNE